MKLNFKHLLVGAALAASMAWAQARTPLVLMTDFGTADGAVSAMRGVAFGVDGGLNISDLTHQIPTFDIWAGAYRLYQTANYWPDGTVFVTVVDPGVGTQRKSVVLKTKNNRYYVGPDNGLYTLIAERDGVAELREIDESVNRLPGSGDSYTFHGRDVYAYTGARLASGAITMEQVGPQLDPASLVRIDYQKSVATEHEVKGNIAILDVNYGNVWTNIPKRDFEQLHLREGDRLRVSIHHGGKRVVELTVPYENSFGGVPKDHALLYLNSLLNVALGINQGNFAQHYHVESGPDWRIELKKLK